MTKPLTLRQNVPVTINAELLAKLDALPPAKLGQRGIQWTPEMDAVLLKYWPIKRQADVAKSLGLTENPCRDRYRLLTGG